MSARLNSIQALRGLAALMIAVLHTLSYALGLGGHEWVAAAKAFSQHFAHFGIDTFFVISGVTLALLMQRLPGAAPLGAAAFLFRRFVRIFPLFWLTLGFLILVAYAAGRDADLSDLMAKPHKLVLLFGAPRIHPVAWTLVFEVYFYALVAIALLFGRRAPQALAVICFVQAGATFAAQAGLIRQPVYLTGQTLEFIAGVAVGFLAFRISLPRPALVAFGGLALAVAVGFYFGPTPARDMAFPRLLIWSLSASAIVWGLLTVEQSGARIPRSLVVLGDMSYSIYLWHWGVMVGLAPSFLFAAAHPLGPLLFVVVATVVTLLISFLSFQLFERPLNRWSARLVANMTAGPQYGSHQPLRGA